MIDEEQFQQQLQHSRVRDGRFERLENGQWVPWPVLTLDKIGRKEAERVVAISRPRGIGR